VRRVAIVGGFGDSTAADTPKLSAEMAAAFQGAATYIASEDWDDLTGRLQAELESGVDAWVVLRGALATQDPKRLIALIEQTGKPALYAASYLVRAGGLMRSRGRCTRPGPTCSMPCSAVRR
jgi:hypothetical protein